MGPIAQRVRLIFSGFPKNRRPFKTKEVQKVKLMIILAALLVTITATCAMAELDSIHANTTNATDIHSTASFMDLNPLFYAPAVVPELNTTEEFDQIIGIGDSGFKTSNPCLINASEAHRFIAWLKTDKTFQKKGQAHIYVCYNFSMDMISNASKAGFHRVYLVVIEPFQGSIHGVVGIDVENIGWIFIEPQIDPRTNAIINNYIMHTGKTENITIFDPYRTLRVGKWSADGSTYTVEGQIVQQLQVVNGRLFQYRISDAAVDLPKDELWQGDTGTTGNN